MGTKNILMIAAAGNDGKDVTSTGFYPAGYGLPNIVAGGLLRRHPVSSCLQRRAHAEQSARACRTAALASRWLAELPSHKVHKAACAPSLVLRSGRQPSRRQPL